MQVGSSLHVGLVVAQRRRLHFLAMMVLRTEHTIRSGAYADVFRPPGDIPAYKLFVSGLHPTNVSQNLARPVDDDRRRKTFLSECEAYERAALHPLLRDHIPRFFHQCEVANVTEAGGSVGCRYLLNCCYAMEFIAGVDTKLGELSGNLPNHIEKALDAFHEAGIHHVTDASVFCPADPPTSRFIDFATVEFEPVE